MFFFLLKDNLIDIISSKSRLRERKSAGVRLNVGMEGKGCHGSGDLSFVFTSERNQLCDLGSSL